MCHLLELAFYSIAPVILYLKECDNMGFNFGKKRKMRKLIGNYVSFRIKEKRAFDDQLKRLDAQLHDKKIEPDIYERLREILEIKYFQQQEEWANIKDKFFNPLIS
jgi:hypothetical protein